MIHHEFDSGPRGLSKMASSEFILRDGDQDLSKGKVLLIIGDATEQLDTIYQTA